MSCEWSISWVGPCKKETQGPTRFCEKHTGQVCVSCGEEAVRECEATFGLVCGAPLCSDCRDDGRGHHTCPRALFNQAADEHLAEILDEIPQVPEEHQKTMKAALKAADMREYDAGMSGSHTDDGARHLRDLAAAWEAGLKGEVPEILKEFADGKPRRGPPSSWYQFQAKRASNG